MAKENFTQSTDEADRAHTAFLVRERLSDLDGTAAETRELLEIFAREVREFGADAADPVTIAESRRVHSLALSGAAVMNAAHNSETVDAYMGAAAKVADLLWHVEENLEWLPSLKAADRCYGLTRAIKDHLRAAGMLPAEPQDDPPIAAPGTALQAGEALEDDREARRVLALRASWEVEGLATSLHDQIADDAHGLPQRSMLRRVRRLSSVIMSALDDDLEGVASIEARFTETELEASHA